MRLIDADALMKKTRRMYAPDEIDSIAPIATSCVTVDDVWRAPTIEAVPVVHARWEEETERFRCSRCRTLFSDEILFINCIDEYMPKYCPECGAKMDGGAE